MSANYNYVCLAGNLTKDPEMKYTNSGTPVVNFDLAVNNPISSQDEVLFISCVAFGKLAEVITQYTSRGKNILVSGRLVLESWTTDEGVKRSKIKVYLSSMQLLGSVNVIGDNVKADIEYYKSVTPVDESDI